MSFRAIFIIDPKAARQGAKTQKVIFKRCFPVIEKRCQKALGGNRYAKIPLDFATQILEELQLLRDPDEFIPKFDSCAREVKHPVYKMCEGALYPVVAFHRGSFVYACVVWEEEELFQNTGLLIDSPGVIFAVTMLENMAKVINKEHVISEKKLESLHKYVSIGFPFGVPSELDFKTVLAISTTAEGAALPKNKGPAWRPIAYKGKQTLHLTVNETVRGLQFDHEDIPDKCEVSGTVTCKVDVEESPEVSLNFVCPVQCGAFKQMAYHPTVQYIDQLPPVLKDAYNKYKTPVEYATQKLRFCPPYDEFVLCQYNVTLPQNDFPIKAFYQMKGDSKSVKVMIQLSLSDGMKNDFESFEIYIPFFNRGPIVDVTCLTSSASVHVLTDKATLVWNIGSKFPGKARECSLDVEVTFASESGGVVKPHKYLHNLNSYIRMSWSMKDYTYSGLLFDTRSVELFPSSKIKVSSGSCFKTMEYKVWNSHGDITDTTFAN